MSSLKSIIRSKYLLWSILSIPGLLIVVNHFSGKLNYDMIMHISGEFSGRFLAITLIATPISLLIPKSGFSKWLVRNRRFFGVGAFAYTLLHTVFYVFEFTFSQLINEFSNIAILSGWIAFFIFIPLSMTSTNGAIKRMGASWKKLQRWVYLAALMAFVHWAMLGIDGPHKSMGGALFHFSPVIILQLYRLYKQRELIFKSYSR